MVIKDVLNLYTGMILGWESVWLMCSLNFFCFSKSQLISPPCEVLPVVLMFLWADLSWENVSSDFFLTSRVKHVLSKLEISFLFIELWVDPPKIMGPLLVHEIRELKVERTGSQQRRLSLEAVRLAVPFVLYFCFPWFSWNIYVSVSNM